MHSSLVQLSVGLQQLCSVVVCVVWEAVKIFKTMEACGSLVELFLQHTQNNAYLLKKKETIKCT